MTTDDPPSDWEEIGSSDGSVFSDWLIVNNDPTSSSSSGSDKDDNDDNHSPIKEDGEDHDEQVDADVDTDTETDTNVRHIFTASRSKKKQVSSLSYDEFIEQNILLHLPAKSLLRIKTLSRHWRTRISNPFFAHLHSTSSRSLDGFFFHSSSSSPDFASFDIIGTRNSLPDPTLSFLPGSPVRVKSSNHGLLCCVNQTLDYIVCNPLISSWARLPPTIDAHGPNTAVAIVMKEPHPFNFSSDYYIVCAYEVLEGIFGFEIFSSESWEWKKSNEIVASESILPGSGVSVGGWAYWRTTMQTVVGYNPELDSFAELSSPFGDEKDVHWEIGEMGRKLCCVGVRDGWGVEALVLEEVGKWREVERFWVAESMGEINVVPLRSQGDYEVAIWNAKLRSVVARNVKRGGERRMVKPSPNYCADFIPFVGSLVPVERGENASENLPNHKLEIKESVVGVEKTAKRCKKD